MVWTYPVTWSIPPDTSSTSHRTSNGIASAELMLQQCWWLEIKQSDRWRVPFSIVPFRSFNERKRRWGCASWMKQWTHWECPPRHHQIRRYYRCRLRYLFCPTKHSLIWEHRTLTLYWGNCSCHSSMIPWNGCSKTVMLGMSEIERIYSVAYLSEMLGFWINLFTIKLLMMTMPKEALSTRSILISREKVVCDEHHSCPKYTWLSLY